MVVLGLLALALAGCTSTGPLVPYRSPQPVVYDQPAYVPASQPRKKRVVPVQAAPAAPKPLVVEKEGGGGGGGGGGSGGGGGGWGG